MRKLKIILQNISKRKAICVLISIQVMISIWLLLTRIDAVEKINKVEEDVELLLSKNSGEIVHMIFADDATHPKDFLKFREQVVKSGCLDYIAYSAKSGLTVKEFENNPKYHKMVEGLNIKKDDLFFDGGIMTLDIESGMEELMQFKLAKGRGLEKDDFNFYKEGKAIPLIAGYSLYENGLVDVGTKITNGDFEDIKYEVVGILSEDSKWFSSELSSNQIMYLRDKFIEPICDNEIYIYDILPSMNYYGEISKGKNKELVLEELKELADKNGLSSKVDFMTVEDDIEEDREFMKNYYKYYLIFSVLFFIIMTFAITVLIILSLDSRKEEIGIRVAMGASFKDIRAMFSGEILFINLFSTLIVFVVYTVLNRLNFRYDEVVSKIDIEPLTFISVIVGVAFMCILPIYIVTKRLSKFNPSELVGGRE
ncbi:ABC transporter permease [Anaerosalibacter bizertensis]|nr:ABC transporter permease [Anaerosalibacter bizertensis]MBU5294205.1 ABC transporter permease [Anaerosalibacter bizertensis]